ncbi:MAG TPA: transporter substrate-binding domain-containing protein [Longimicrobium sp.]
MTKRRDRGLFARLQCFLLLLAVLGCDQRDSPSRPAANPTGVDRIIQRGEMRVGYLVWPPAVTRDQRTGEIGGIFPDMVKQLADALRVRVVWQEVTLANFSAALNTGQIDFSIGPTFVTIPRAAVVSFTQPVAYVGNAAVVRTNSDFRPASFEEVDRPGIKVAVLQGQALQELVARSFRSAQPVVLSGSDLTAPLAAVSSGRADIGFMNSVTVEAYAAAHPEVTPVLRDARIEVLPLAWATRTRDDDLRNFLDASITYLKSTGRIAEFQQKASTPLLYDIPDLEPVRQR